MFLVYSHITTIMYKILSEKWANVSHLAGGLARDSCKSCIHGDEIEASAMFVSAPQADKLMGRKGH